jgi:hypothetical protein
VTTGRRLYDTAAAAAALDVPAQRIYEWHSRHLVTEADSVPGRGRSGRAPLYDLEDLKPLAEAYHQRAATRRDGPI